MVAGIVIITVVVGVITGIGINRRDPRATANTDPRSGPTVDDACGPCCVVLKTQRRISNRNRIRKAA